MDIAPWRAVCDISEALYVGDGYHWRQVSRRPGRRRVRGGTSAELSAGVCGSRAILSMRQRVWTVLVIGSECRGPRSGFIAPERGPVVLGGEGDAYAAGDGAGVRSTATLGEVIG